MTDQTPNDPNPTEHDDDEMRFAPRETSPTDDSADDQGNAPLEVDVAELDALASELDTLALSEADISDDDQAAAPTVTDAPASIPPEIDVESALGAATGAGLDDMIAQQEAEERVVYEEQARLDDILANPLPLPRRLDMERGNINALLPGVALVALGGWLTFAYTTGSAPPAPTVVAMLVGLLAVMLVLAWAGSGRWNRGTLFLAVWGGFSAGGVYLAGNVLGAGLVPLLVVALGVAFVISGVFARPASGAMVLVGLMFMVGGAVALAMALGLVPPAVLETVRLGWMGVAVLAGLVLLLPALQRLRR